MDRITESLLQEFSTEHGIARLPEDKRFEQFAAYITVRRQFSETFDPQDIVTGAGGDAGIDAITIIANGVLMTDLESFLDHAERAGSLDVTFIFVQAERSASFETMKIGQFAFGVLDFFREHPVLPQNDTIKEAVAIMSAAYKRSSKFKHGNPACR